MISMLAMSNIQEHNFLKNFIVEYNKPSIRKVLNLLVKQDDELIEEYNNTYNQLLNGNFVMAYDPKITFKIIKGASGDQYYFYRNEELITHGSVLWMIRTLYWFMDSLVLIECSKNELLNILENETGLDSTVIHNMTWHSLID
ncbi:hypothetical protein ACFVSK_21080, partial [Cellulosimicrobium cellulans]|uniref:hypothetical protein n=1 Tax=Cellulosimicrobium cellulans TaxID=1710 RepID=UPI0036E43CEF